MAKTKIKKEDLIEAAKSIPLIAKKEGWVLTFDKEEGNLFYSPKRIVDNTELCQMSDEYAVYFDRNCKPCGIMIESFQENFLKHHKNFQKLSNEIFKGRGKVKEVSPNKGNKKEKTEMLSSFIESNLIKEVGTNLVAV